MTGKTFTIVWEELNLSLSPSRMPATKGALELLQSRVPGRKATRTGLAPAGGTSSACCSKHTLLTPPHLPKSAQLWVKYRDPLLPFS